MPNITAVAAECPECAAPVAIQPDARMSEIVECPECRSELEIGSTDPWTLELAPDVEEDWGE